MIDFEYSTNAGSTYSDNQSTIFGLDPCQRSMHFLVGGTGIGIRIGTGIHARSTG